MSTTWQSLFVALRGVLYAFLFAMLWTWLAVAVRPLDQRLPITLPPSARPLGIAVALAGGVLVAWCLVTFITRGRGTPAPFDPPREFVATGPYRYARNPMYIGAGIAILGAGLMVASPAIVLLALFFWLAAHLFVVLYEEPALESRFGDGYLAYKSSVNRWVPQVPREKPGA